MPEGSVDDQLEAGRFFSRYECKQILAQTSDALAYLHTLDPQIVHRDIKPSNILILYRRPDDIFVKFANFSLSREGDDLMTICGTALYLAPEVHEASAIRPGERGRYTAFVDIWSLGVVVA
jgi:serine/threonine protein kinase